MSLFKFYYLIIVAFCTLFISACGFQPLYVDQSDMGTGATVPFHSVSVSNIPNQDGQYLRNKLIDTIYINGIPQNPRYRLSMTGLNESITPLGIRKDETATRAQMRISVKLNLIDVKTGETVLNRGLIATNSFNQLSSQYTTNVSNQYARERALDELSRQTVKELALFFQRDGGR